MNSLKNPIKRFALLVLLLVATLCVASCGKTITNANISNPNDVYFSVTEGTYTYELTKGEVYAEVKNDFGLTTLLSLVDTHLLKNTQNGAKSFWDSVTADEINEAIKDAKFPEGTEEMTKEEIEEAEEAFKNSMYETYGYLTLAQIEDHYHLQLAKKAYAQAKLDEEVAAIGGAEEYLTEAEIETYYNANYENKYWTIVLPYVSVKQYQTSLAHANVKIEDGKWLNAKTNTALTATEIVQVFINLYNEMFGYKGKLVAAQNGDYTLENGVYTFNKVENDINYTASELKAYHSAIASYVIDKMEAYNKDASVDGNWYTAKPVAYNSGSLHFLVLNALVEEAKSLEEVKAEVMEELIAADLTNSYINGQMDELRESNELKIYDTDIEAAYIKSISSDDVEYKQTKQSQESLVASIKGKEFTADELFALIDKLQGPALAVSKILTERLANNPAFNPYYDFATGKWLDEEQHDHYDEIVKTEKEAFKKGDYVEYGYDPDTMSWKEFMKEVYNAANEDEMALAFLKDTLSSEFAKSLQTLTKMENGKYVATEEDELWQMILGVMKEQQEKYFKVTGVHLLISAYENPVKQVAGGAGLDPKDWTESQKTLAKELYNQVVDYLKANVNFQEDYTNLKDSEVTEKEKAQADKVAKLLEKVVKAFANAPYYNENAVEGVEYTFEGIEVSKFKSAGLSVKFEDLGTFTNGKMVEAFNDAAKSIWDKDPDSKLVSYYSSAIETQFGYHLYVNTSCTDIPSWTASLKFRINEDETKIQYRYTCDAEWTDLIDKPAEIEAGRSVSFRIYSSAVEWQYSGGQWTKLASLSDLNLESQKTGVLPTLGIVRCYVDSKLYSDLTTQMKSAYTTYFKAVYDEVGGSYYPTIQQLKALQTLTIDIHGNQNYTLEDVNYVIERYIATYNGKLTYLSE